MRPEDERQAILTRLLGPPGSEVSCEQCFEQLDEYVELELAGADANRRLPGLREHLQGCPACREDHESLREFVRLQGGPRPPGGGGPPRK